MITVDDVIRDRMRADRFYGSDPLEVLVELENVRELEKHSIALLKALNHFQQQILLMTALGFTVRRIASELNRNHATIVGCRRTLGKRLLTFADEDRISRLKERLEHVKGRRRKKLAEENQRRYAVRRALKYLIGLL